MTTQATPTARQWVNGTRPQSRKDLQRAKLAEVTVERQDPFQVQPLDHGPARSVREAPIPLGLVAEIIPSCSFVVTIDAVNGDGPQVEELSAQLDRARSLAAGAEQCQRLIDNVIGGEQPDGTSRQPGEQIAVPGIA